MTGMFMGIHERLPQDATAAHVAEAHRDDPEALRTHGVRYLRYWIDEDARKVFCLVEAPSAEAAATAHRLRVDRIYRVRQGEQDEQPFKDDRR